MSMRRAFCDILVPVKLSCGSVDRALLGVTSRCISCSSTNMTKPKSASCLMCDNVIIIDSGTFVCSCVHVLLKKIQA